MLQTLDLLDKECGDNSSPPSEWNPFRKFSFQSTLGINLDKSGVCQTICFRVDIEWIRDQTVTNIH